MRFKHYCLTITLIILGVAGLAQDIPARPVPPRLVNDFANILSDSEIEALETKLVRYNDTTGTQICVVTVVSLGDIPSNDFAYQIGEKWGVGHKDDNGAVILVKPKTAEESGDVSIQVGYGLEPYVTDARARRIIEREMIPSFKENDYYTGIDNACDVIIGLATGAFTPEEYDDDTDEMVDSIIMILILLFVIAVIKRLGKGKDGTGTGRSSGFWEGMFLGSMMSGGRRGSSWGGSSGSSWGGGHSSGGFGGFGGGHFGGGGASGKW